jgi:hypothetical protein
LRRVEVMNQNAKMVHIVSVRVAALRVVSALGVVKLLCGAALVVVIVAGTATVRLTDVPSVVGVTGFGEKVQVIPAGALGQVSATGAAEFPWSCTEN